MPPSPELVAAFENHRAGRLEAAEQLYRQVLAVQPNQPDALHLLGMIAFQVGRLDDAVQLIRRAIESDGSRSDFYNNLGNILGQQGKPAEAVVAYRRALELKPIDATARSNLLVSLQYDENITLAELAAAHTEFEHLHAAPLVAERRPLQIDRNPDRPLILGFLCPNFRQHAVGHFVIGPLENLDRNGFQVVCYSDQVGGDDYTRRFQAASSVWRETSNLTNAQLAEQVRADRVDILFDLAGHTAKNRLLVFARKPAPLQITWADYVGTTGLAAMDFILADRYEIPPASEKYYTERVLRMPHGYVCYDPPVYAPPVSRLPATSRGSVTFSSFNYRPKITGKTIDVWSKILRRVSSSRLVLKNGGLQDPAVSRPLLNEFSARGIDPERIECLGWSPHVELLAEYNRIDLALDPIPYNGGLTTCEALWMGVPVITCPGETFASRHSLSHLSNVGLIETIARNLDEYVKIAVSLAGDLPHLATLRSGLRERMAASLLCDPKRFAQDFMSLLRGIWRDWCQTEKRSYN